MPWQFLSSRIPCSLLVADSNNVAAFKFDKIGSIREHPGVSSGPFYVNEYYDGGLSYPIRRAKVYEQCPSQGPFNIVAEYHSSDLLDLNDRCAQEDKDDDGSYTTAVANCRFLHSTLSLPEYETSPFVLNHNDLSANNILVRSRPSPRYNSKWPLVLCFFQVDENVTTDFCVFII